MNLKHGTKYMRNTKTGVIFPFNQFAANNANIEVFVHTDKGVKSNDDSQAASAGSLDSTPRPEIGEGVQPVASVGVAVVPARRAGKPVKLPS